MALVQSSGRQSSSWQLAASLGSAGWLAGYPAGCPADNGSLVILLAVLLAILLAHPGLAIWHIETWQSASEIK